MAPWEIWTYNFEDEQTHPVVIFGNSARVADPEIERVNVFLCTSLRGPARFLFTPPRASARVARMSDDRPMPSANRRQLFWKTE